MAFPENGHSSASPEATLVRPRGVVHQAVRSPLHRMRDGQEAHPTCRSALRRPLPPAQRVTSLNGEVGAQDDLRVAWGNRTRRRPILRASRSSGSGAGHVCVGAF